MGNPLNDFEIWMREYREALTETQRFYATDTGAQQIASVDAALMYLAAYREIQDNQEGR